MDVQTYLKRIKYSKPVQRNFQSLRGVHIAHMRNVPFENLDIHLGKAIQLSEQEIWDKIVLRKRGGFCYELNGLFAWLLKEIGFNVTYLNGRVFREDGSLGLNFDHIVLLVHIPGASLHWIADVGFGDSFIEPLRYAFDDEQVQGTGVYRLEEADGGVSLWQKSNGEDWSPQYFFDMKPRRFPEDYESTCFYHQTSPNSSFTRHRFTSRATQDGRITLDKRQLIITKDGRRTKKGVKNDAEYYKLLKKHFEIVL